MLVCNADAAEEFGLAALPDLGGAEGLTIGAPPEFETRSPFGLAGFQELYGFEVGEFVPLEIGQPIAAALSSGAIDCGNLFSTMSVITTEGFVALEDTDNVVPFEAVLPLVRSEVVDDTLTVHARRRQRRSRHRGAEGADGAGRGRCARARRRRRGVAGQPLSRAPSSDVIEVTDLSKRFGSRVAVDHLSFSAQPGRVTGFLGPNGSGKSTTMRCMVGLDRPQTGHTRFSGRRFTDIVRPLTEIAALLDAGYVHPGRTGRDHLRWLAASNGLGMSRVDDVLAMVGMSEVGSLRVRALLAGHAPAARPRRRAARRSAHGDPRRAGQRARSGRHQVGARRARLPRRRRSNGPGQQPSAVGDATDGARPRRDRAGAADRAVLGRRLRRAARRPVGAGPLAAPHRAARPARAVRSPHRGVRRRHRPPARRAARAGRRGRRRPRDRPARVDDADRIAGGRVPACHRAGGRLPGTGTGGHRRHPNRTTATARPPPQPNESGGWAPPAPPPGGPS